MDYIGYEFFEIKNVVFIAREKTAIDFKSRIIYYIQASIKYSEVYVGTTNWRSRVVGRARTIGNRVTVKSRSRVRIPPSPPH